MKKVIVDDSACICCGACMSMAPDVFGYGASGTSTPKKEFVSDDDKNAIAAMEGCPTSAISLVDAEENHTHCKNCNCNPCECDKNGSCDCEEEKAA